MDAISKKAISKKSNDPFLSSVFCDICQKFINTDKNNVDYNKQKL